MMNPKIGLALSGGGARGLSHIGVLKVLRRENIPINCIAGTSMGSIMAAFYAVGFSIEEMEDIALRFSHVRELAKLIDISPTRRGLLEGQRVREYFRHLFERDYKIQNLDLPIAINAVDLKSGDEVVMKSGSLLTAMFASFAVPGIFSPVEVNGKLLIDGGVLNNLPVDHAWNLGPDFVIGVDVEQDPHDDFNWSFQEVHKKIGFHTPPFLKDFYRAQMIMMRKMTNEKMKLFSPSVLINPKMPGNVTMFAGFTKARELIQAGVEAAEQKMKMIEDIIRK